VGLAVGERDVAVRARGERAKGVALCPCVDARLVEPHRGAAREAVPGDDGRKGVVHAGERAREAVEDDIGDADGAPVLELRVERGGAVREGLRRDRVEVDLEVSSGREDEAIGIHGRVRSFPFEKGASGMARCGGRKELERHFGELGGSELPPRR